ncbi:hypothetical protein POTOM_037147 [Populus tomentosa]|uniref:DAGKc domain-containing protein n=1 Tax=Populus tomentosa TaxID=118781 RepID=A0A8X8CNT8_POPTO|nr:hypothetical protein POTOM_037147 [Populus tomentosa]
MTEPAIPETIPTETLPLNLPADAGNDGCTVAMGTHTSPQENTISVEDGNITEEVQYTIAAGKNKARASGLNGPLHTQPPKQTDSRKGIPKKPMEEMHIVPFSSKHGIVESNLDSESDEGETDNDPVHDYQLIEDNQLLITGFDRCVESKMATLISTSEASSSADAPSLVALDETPGIICVGGDGIINEVLNGLLIRDNQKEGISIPIGIIPAGSDNSLIWTVLGVRDPISAAISIVKGGLTATDVFAVEWIQSGVIHFGMTVSYYGFVSDVLELSEKYQKRFGPLRYFVAGFLKFLCLPKYSYEVEYLPASREDRDGKQSAERDMVDMSDLYTDVMRRSNKDGIPRASSLSSIDSIMTPSRMSGGDLDTTCSSTRASTEPSEYVRGLDPKAKRLSSGRTNVMAEPEVIHPQLPLSTTPNWPRTRSKSRADKGWTGLTATHDPSRCSWGNAAPNDREDISSTLSDPGPIWDAEPKWDTEPNWDVENPIELPGPSDDIEAGMKKEAIPRFEDKWEIIKGQFLGIMVCNHACRTVQSSQVVAPRAEHDDNTMDMLLVHGSGRLRLLRFFLLLQMGQHLSLPYVEYIKVKSVKIKAGKHTHNGCGIDGELFQLNGQVISSLLPEQCRLIGRSPNHPV